MNKGFFFAEGLKFFDNITVKEKLDEYEAPSWSRNIEKLSLIKKPITFRDTFESCPEIEPFSTCKLEFGSAGSKNEESTLELSTEESVRVLPPTPKVRKPISIIMSNIRRIDFDLPEDYELQVKTTTVVIEDDTITETMV